MDSDVLLLTIYFLVVIYVLYQMALSLEAQQEDQVIISLNTENLLEKVDAQIAQLPQPNRLKASISSGLFGGFNGQKMPSELRQLELTLPSHAEDGRRSSISVTVMPLGKRPLAPPIRFLNVQVTNRTPDAQVYIDWDRSSFTLMSPLSQRVIRIIPNMNLDLSQPQVFSVVNPSESLKIDVTTERNFNRNGETQRLEVQQPLIDVNSLAMLLMPKVAGFEGLVSEKSVYTLNLIVGLRRIAERQSQTTYLLLPFNFNMTLLPGEIAFPPLRWLLDRPRRDPEAFWSTFIGRPPNLKR